MVKSMYSGVTGMKAHQTKLDVIGNNVANVNTYGFKSSRATFRDVYYQSLRTASSPTANLGGTNPSGVGYGATIASVDLQMTGASVTNTGNPMDVAISGDGFFQVQDGDGNVFYTRAGMLDIDADGNLVDMNGYFVLGVSGNPVGQPAASNPINVLQAMGTVPATRATVSEDINGNKVTISASNATTEGNVNISITSSDNLPIGQKALAVVGTSNIVVQLNSKEIFTNLAAVEQAINDAITDANNGEHPAGQFTVSMEPDTMFTMPEVVAKGGLSGAEVAGTNFGFVKGNVLTAAAGTNDKLFGGWTVKEVGNTFSGDGDVTFSLQQDLPIENGVGGQFVMSATVNGVSYTGTVLQSQMDTAGSIVLKRTGGDDNDTITMNYPSFKTLMTGATQSTDPYTETDKENDLIPPGYVVGQVGPEFAGKTLVFADVTVTGAATPSHESFDLGLGSRSFKLKDGTAGGALTVKDLTGVSIGADGVIIANHSILGAKEVGRIDLATFDNMAALVQSGNSYYTTSANSGTAGVTIAGTGGTGGLKTSSLELSNVDLSQEFADMITTQRGFQANSRLITVSDTLLEELVNLKR